MSGILIPCLKCQATLPLAIFNTAQMGLCPGCHTPSQVEVFPALFKPLPTGQLGEQILVPSEASCFYHPEKRALVPCGACGRFLCAVCDVELNQEHLCPACLDAGRKKGKLPQLESRRFLYDGAALSTAILPLVIFPLWFMTVVTAPTAIVLAIFSWYRPGSILQRTHLRAYLAIFIALLQIGGWIFLIAMIIKEGLEK